MMPRESLAAISLISLDAAKFTSVSKPAGKNPRRSSCKLERLTFALVNMKRAPGQRSSAPPGAPAESPCSKATNFSFQTVATFATPPETMRCTGNESNSSLEKMNSDEGRDFVNRRNPGSFFGKLAQIFLLSLPPNRKRLDHAIGSYGKTIAGRSPQRTQ